VLDADTVAPRQVKELEQASSSSASSTNNSGGDASQQGGDQQALQKELEALKVGEAAVLAELQREKAAVRQRAEELSLAKQQNAELMTQLTEAARHEKAAKALEGELEGARRRASNLAEEMALAKQQNQALLRDLDGRMQAEVGEREEALAAVKAELERCKQAQGAAEDRAAALEKELEGARAELVQAQEALVGERAEADRLEGEVEALRAEMAAPQRERKVSEEDGDGELVEDLQRQVEALRLELSTAHARQQALHEQLTAAKQQQQQRPATPKKGEAAAEHPLADLTPLQAASAPAPARASPGPVPAVPGGDLIDLGGLNDPLLPPTTQAVSTSLAVSVEAAGATEVATLRERVGELERELEGHRRRASSVTEAEEAQRDMALELGALEAKLAAQRGGEQELRATVAQREARVVDLEKELQGLRAAVQVGDTGRDEELATLRGGLEGEQQAHAVARQAVEELTGRVETLQAELGQARRELLEKGSQLLAVGKDADERRAEEAKAEEVLRDTKRTLEERMVVLRREADGARAELEGARKELADVREQLRALQEEKGSLGEAARLAAADQAQAAEAREALRGERDALREELAVGGVAWRGV
jgi:chromosome segregation ATPase